MTWEEEPIVERIRDLFRPHGYPYTDREARRKRSKRLRYFLTVFGAIHWAERIEPRRSLQRQGRIVL
ncbi:MAG TPA: hypothetical protein VGR87_10395 [Candidatus Limnocylindria bacterium]|nr:hypothetical protein [Candidatus Limnocylindria bacterium]